MQKWILARLRVSSDQLAPSPSQRGLISYLLGS